jgi:hypothetical protein
VTDLQKAILAERSACAGIVAEMERMTANQLDGDVGKIIVRAFQSVEKRILEQPLPNAKKKHAIMPGDAAKNLP